MTLYAVTYRPATAAHGSRYNVVNCRTGRRHVVSLNGNAVRPDADAAATAYGRDTGRAAEHNQYAGALGKARLFLIDGAS